MQFSLDDFLLAEERVHQLLIPSPVVRSTWLSELVGGEVFLKLECLNPGNSFKLRGATSALLACEERPEMVVTASGGNHGLGVAIAAKLLDIPATVYLPTSSSQHRVRLLEERGAEVVLYGNSFDEADIHARSVAREKGHLYVHAFADPRVIEGQGTIAAELIKQVPDMDTMVVSVGGGGLITGIGRCLDAHGRNEVDIFAVETVGADCLNRSMRAGKLVELPEISSIAKTLGARKTTPEIFDYLRRRIKDSVVVSDAETVMAMVEFINHEKLIVEPAASCIIAALLGGKIDLEGKTTVVVVCGSNVTLGNLQEWLERFKLELKRQ